MNVDYTSIKPVAADWKFIPDLAEFARLIAESWTRQTCAPRLRHKWSETNRTCGQCSVTAFLVEDIFGGEVFAMVLPEGSRHCYNRVDGKVFDLTAAQFDGSDVALVYDCAHAQRREDHFGVRGAETEKFFRYRELRRNLVEAAIASAERSGAITLFQRKVYSALLDVPAGETVSYGELARRIGCESAQAVGGALRRNPFAPVVPCHRVVCADGSIGGFNGATEGSEIERKRQLLASEAQSSAEVKG